MKVWFELQDGQVRAKPVLLLFIYRNPNADADAVAVGRANPSGSVPRSLTCTCMISVESSQVWAHSRVAFRERTRTLLESFVSGDGDGLACFLTRIPTCGRRFDRRWSTRNTSVPRANLSHSWKWRDARIEAVMLLKSLLWFGEVGRGEA